MLEAGVRKLQFIDIGVQQREGNSKQPLER